MSVDITNLKFSVINGQIDDALKQKKKSVKATLHIGGAMRFPVEISYNYTEGPNGQVVNTEVPYDIGDHGLIWAKEISDAYLDGKNGEFLIWLF